MLTFSYLVATINQPLVDSTLYTIDTYFGVSSPSIVLWFRTHEEWRTVFVHIYNTYNYQFPFVIFYFSSRGDVTQLQRFFMQFMIAAPLTIVLSGFFPAEGPYVWYHYTPDIELLKALNQLRELRHNIVDLTTQNGIVTIPSFHTVMACLYTYAFRNQRKIIFIPILILNILMIFSCLPIGQHYFADLLAGIAVAAIGIGLETLLFTYTLRHTADGRAFQKTSASDQKHYQTPFALSLAKSDSETENQ